MVRRARGPTDKDVAADRELAPEWRDEHVTSVAIEGGFAPFGTPTRIPAETDPTRSWALAIDHARTLERLAQRGHAAHLKPGTVEIGEARRGHDRALQSEPPRPAEPCGPPLHAAQ